MVIAHDVPGHVNLLIPGPRPQWFGGVRLEKTGVTCHLMPLYRHGHLAAQIGPQLRTRMTGETGFTFNDVDPALFAELQRLVSLCAETLAPGSGVNPGPRRTPQS